MKTNVENASILNRICELKSEERLDNKNTQKIIKITQNDIITCKFNDRGFCKYRENCYNFHSIQICDKFQRAGKCMTQGCKSRHPKDCFFGQRKK